ncbi:MAG TPA: hypothetical protein PLI95_18690, partial [Polyangiaceae bacterium]|nr:hypothetical protein [Polyangiaceae bacterium]
MKPHQHNVVSIESAKKQADPQQATGEPAPAPPVASVPPANALVALVRANVELFSDDFGEPHAAVKTGSRSGVYRVRSQAFRAWLDHAHYTAFGTLPRSNVRRDALSLIEGLARFESPVQPVMVRLANHDGCIYLDLANDQRQVIRIAPDGWRVQEVSPVRFRRPKGMLALPVPVRGGSVAELRPFVNVASDQAFYLLIAWLVGGMRPDGPYPVLALVGEQGSAKSTTARVLRRMIDDNKALLRSLPKSERDLAVSAVNSWIMSYDNLSGLQPQQSDWMCRLATGGGVAGRALYTDSDEAILPFMRPVMLNGIDDIAVRGDLVERAMVIHAPTILPAGRVDEAAFWRDFAVACPRILGALLDGVVAALANLERTRLTESPRMADFARWVVAAEPGLGWPPGTFMSAYVGNRQETDAEALDRDALAAVLLRWPELRQVGKWSGTAERLYEALCAVATDRETRAHTWPKAHNALGGQLRRIAPSLRAVGIEVVIEKRTAHERPITITRSPGEPSSLSSPSSTGEQPASAVTAVTAVTAPPVESQASGPRATPAPEPSPISAAEGTVAVPSGEPSPNDDSPVVTVESTEDDGALEFLETVTPDRPRLLASVVALRVALDQVLNVDGAVHLSTEGSFLSVWTEHARLIRLASIGWTCGFQISATLDHPVAKKLVKALRGEGGDLDQYVEEVGLVVGNITIPWATEAAATPPEFGRSELSFGVTPA